MRLKRFFSLLLPLTIMVGTVSFSVITATAATIHPNADKYFYFCIEYTDYDGSDESRYYCDDYSDKCRIMNPVKVYEDGFYNVGGDFISFTELCGNLTYNDNVQQYWKDGEDVVYIDSVADAVDLILTYYSDSEIYGCPYMTDSDNCGVCEIELSEYAMSNGFLESINCSMGEFDSGVMAFFNGTKLADYGMSNYKWSNDTLSGGDVFRLVCDWSGFFELMSYETTACDDLIRSIGDYYEQKTERIDGVDEAEEAYTAALSGWFGEDDTQTLAENLMQALPGIKEDTASAGEVSIAAYPQGKTFYAKGNTNAYLSARANKYKGNLTYQWYRDGEKIDGATTSGYYLKDEPLGKHSYKVDVTATISTLNTDTKSAETEITVYNAPTIALKGNSKIFAVKDKEISLSIQANCDTELYPGNELKYQWYLSADSKYGLSRTINGETDSTLKLTLTEYDTSYYYAVATDSGNNSVKSEIIQVTVVPTYDENGWNGTFEEDKDEPELDTDLLIYKIGTPAELAWYADYVNSATKVSKNNYCSVYGAILTADIDLNSYPWTPIGWGGGCVPFNFTFDGDGHTVKNLYCNNYNSGLFGEIGYTIDDGYDVQNKYCYIKNLTVEGYSHNDANAGLVAGKATCTYFENVTVKGNAGDDKTSYAGGIVGYESGCKFTNCINYADICAKSENGYSGGIAGYQSRTWACTGGDVLKDNTKYLKTVIKNCINLGTVTGSKNGAMLGYVTNYDNDFGNYDSYTYTHLDPNSFGYKYCVAVEFDNNITLSTASAKTLSAKKTLTEIEMAATVDASECAEGKCSMNIFKNGLTVSDSALSGDVTVYINNKDDNTENGVVILALYDTNGKMLEIKALPKELNAGHNLVDFKDLSVKYTGDYKIKSMLWNNLSALVPLANTAESEIANN